MPLKSPCGRGQRRWVPCAQATVASAPQAENFDGSSRCGHGSQCVSLIRYTCPGNWIFQSEIFHFYRKRLRLSSRSMILGRACRGGRFLAAGGAQEISRAIFSQLTGKFVPGVFGSGSLSVPRTMARARFPGFVLLYLCWLASRFKHSRTRCAQSSHSK